MHVRWGQFGFGSKGFYVGTTSKVASVGPSCRVGAGGAAVYGMGGSMGVRKDGSLDLADLETDASFGAGFNAGLSCGVTTRIAWLPK